MTKENSIARRLGIPKEKYLNDLERYSIILEPMDFAQSEQGEYLLQVANEARELLNSKKNKFFYPIRNKVREKYISEKLSKIEKSLKIDSDYFLCFSIVKKNRISLKVLKNKFSNFLDTITGGKYTIS